MNLKPFTTPLPLNDQSWLSVVRMSYGAGVQWTARTYTLPHSRASPAR